MGEKMGHFREKTFCSLRQWKTDDVGYKLTSLLKHKNMVNM